jgi:hypothetical protein
MFLLHSFHHPSATSDILGRNILVNISFSNALNLCPYLEMREKVSHTQETTGNIKIFYILIFIV